MPRIPYIGNQVGGPGAPDLVSARPNQALGRLGDAAARAEAVFEDLRAGEAVAKGAKLLADFRVGREKRQIELREADQDPLTFGDRSAADFDEAAQKLLATTDDEYVQGFLSRRLDALKVQETAEAINWGAEQHYVRVGTQLDEATKTNANVVFSKPTSFDAVWDETEASIRASGLPQAVIEKRLAVSKAALGRSAVYGLVERNPHEAVKQLNGGVWDTIVDEGVKVSAVNAAQAEIKRRDTEARLLQAARAGAATATLDVQINQFANGQGPDPGQAAIDALKEGLKPDEWATIQKRYDDARARRAKADEDMVNVAAIIEGGGHIDPNDTDAVKAYDQYFKKNVLPALAQSEDPGAAALAFVARQGIVPETIKSTIRANLRSGTPEERAAAAQTLEQVKAVAPHAIKDFDDDTLRQANAISAYIDSGMRVEDATRLVDENMRQPKPVTDALTTAYNELTKDDTTAAWVEEMQGGWFSTVGLTVPIAAEVDASVRREFMRNGGNLEAARRTTVDLMGKRYGETTVNGTRELTRNPVEKFYELPWLKGDELARAIKLEAVADLSRNAATDGPLNPDRVRVLPYPAKGVTQPDGRPAYALEVQDSLGLWYVQMDEDPQSPTYGLPLPWWPALEKERGERKTEADKLIEAARTRGLPLPERARRTNEPFASGVR